MYAFKNEFKDAKSRTVPQETRIDDALLFCGKDLPDIEV
jgi:hypothetical protein